MFLGFAIYVPRSKHLHLIAAGPNIFFRNLDSVAKPTIINFEHAIKYGANQANELPWKSLLDTFACTECGRCNAVCPTAITNKPLQPKKVLYNIKMNLKHETSDNIKNKYFNKISIKCSNNNKITKKKKALIKPEYLDKNQSQRSSDQINLEEIWSCTTCAACVEVCPVIIDSVPTSLIEMRRHLILMEAKNYPKELNNCFKGLENNHNPWNITAIRKTKWEKECNVPIFSKLVNKKPEYLFYIGCAGSIDDKAKKTQQSLIKIFKKYNIDFAILGNEEKCCGDPARRLGNEYLYDILVRKNIDILKKYDITKIITACPHCFNQFKNEYKDYGINISVKHHSQILEEIISNNKISFNNKEKQNETITFHDPCYLGRYNDEYLAPRNVLTSCTQRNIKEMKMSKQKSFCCGAGGGHMFMEERLGNKISHTRLNHAIATKSHTIATACPFCIRMLNDAACDKNIEQQVQIKDIAEIFIKKII